MKSHRRPCVKSSEELERVLAGWELHICPASVPFFLDLSPSCGFSTLRLCGFYGN